MMNRFLIVAAIGAQAFFANAQQTALQVFTNASGSGPGIVTLRTTMDALGSKNVTGHPFSATEERHSLQVLGDGTRIETTDSDKFYRDDQGRTRIERKDGTVMIQDPVAGVTAELDGNHKLVRRNSFKTLERGAIVPDTKEMVAKMEAEAKMRKSEQRVEGFQVAGMPAVGVALDAQKLSLERAQTLEKKQAQQEDLGYQSVGGVTAKGARTTTTIPAGAIGNDKQIQIVSERWFSEDLQTTVKSTNSDPRFGETSYQMTNILQGPPDPSLFLIPADSHQ